MIETTNTKDHTHKLTNNQVKSVSIMEVGLFPLLGQYLNQLVQAISSGLWQVTVFLFGPRHDAGAMDGLDKLYLKVTVWSAIGTGVLAAVAFVGNFNLIAELAHNHGIPYPMAYFIPFSLDGFVVISILIVFGAALVGQRAGLIKLLVLASSLTGIYFNVSGVLINDNADTLPWMSLLLHSVLGAMLYLAVEVTAHQITSYIKRKSILRSNEVLQDEITKLQSQKVGLASEVDTERARLMAQIEDETAAEKRRLSGELVSIQGQTDAAQAELDRLQDQIETAKNDKSLFTEKHLRAAYALGRNWDATGKEIGDHVGMSQTTGNALKNELKPLLNGMAEHG